MTTLETLMHLICLHGSKFDQEGWGGTSWYHTLREVLATL